MAMFNKDKARKCYAYLHNKWLLGPGYTLYLAGSGANPRTYQEKKGITYITHETDVVPPSQCSCGAAHECIVMGIIEKSEHVLYFLNIQTSEIDLNQPWLKSRPKTSLDGKSAEIKEFEPMTGAGLSPMKRKAMLLGISYEPCLSTINYITQLPN